MQRLAGTIMWDRTSPAATAVAKPVVKARPREIAKDKTFTETVCANAAAATVEEPVGEARPLGIAQSEVEGSSGEAGSSWSGAERTPSAGEELGLLESQSRVPRRKMKLQRAPVKLDLIGPLVVSTNTAAVAVAVLVDEA